MSGPGRDYARLVGDTYRSTQFQGNLKFLDQIKPELVEEWKRVAGIYSPSGSEVLRAEYLTAKFREYGVSDAHVDRTGNAVALIDSGRPGPTTVFLATMDDLKPVAELVKGWKKPVEEREGKLWGPGTNIGSICVNALALVRLFKRSGFRGRVYVVGVTEEETGFAGTKDFIRDHPGEIDYLVDIMAGARSVSYGALCIRWFKVHYKGPKAHTLQGAGPNVTKGVAKSVSRVFGIPLPPETYLNVSMLGAGSVFNHRSDDGWHSVDLRSTELETVDRLHGEIKKIVEKIAEEEQLEAWIEMVSDTPGGQIPGARDSPLTRVAEEGIRLTGVEPRVSNRGSCNMNAGIAAGVLSISTGGDRGGARGDPGEYANIEPVFEGIRLNYLIGYTLGNLDP